MYTIRIDGINAQFIATTVVKSWDQFKGKTVTQSLRPADSLILCMKSFVYEKYIRLVPHAKTKIHRSTRQFHQESEGLAQQHTSTDR